MSLTLDKLNDDVIFCILLFLHDTSRHSLVSVLSVNKALHSVAVPVVHRSCVLDFALDQHESTVQRIQSWLKERSFILPFIRNLTVKGSYIPQWSAAGPTEKWGAIIQLLSQIPTGGLRSFTFCFHQQLPIILLDALHQHHPLAHLHVQNWTRISRDAPCGDPAELALANSPSLRSLHAKFSRSSDGRRDFSDAAFYRIVKLSPNLKAVSQTSSYFPSCVRSMPSMEERQAREKEVQSFAVDVPRRKGIKSLEMDSFSVGTLRDLCSFLDLGSLRNLDIKLTFHHINSDLNTAFTTFLASCEPLESLSIELGTSQSWDLILSAIRLHHSSSLSTLSLHQSESRTLQSMRVCLTLDELANICHSCPQLISLGIDIDRTAGKEKESAYYTILSRFFHLRTLKIYMDTGAVYSYALHLVSRMSKEEEVDLRSKADSYPFIDKEFALNVWDMVSKRDLHWVWEDSQGITRSSHLHELVLYMGNQVLTRGMGGYDTTSKAQQVTVRRSERDDRPAELDVNVINRLEECYKREQESLISLSNYTMKERQQRWKGLGERS